MTSLKISNLMPSIRLSSNNDWTHFHKGDQIYFAMTKVRFLMLGDTNLLFALTKGLFYMNLVSRSLSFSLVMIFPIHI